MTWFRAIFAAGLSVLLPGAGHALIRDWLRALVFAGVYFLAIGFFFPVGEIAAAGSMAEAMDIVTTKTDSISQFVLSFLVLFATIDATFRAVGFPPGGSTSNEGPSCPNCGKELDQDLTFCHWCTTRLEPIEPETPEGPTDPETAERETEETPRP
ncbi:zinc ribbon domain-containing protein [Natronorubrum halophilum]|uniref:zinc ribbon domain-containing protein n=1 Tax=Natronorubrum halophilum TaxID=1702106 RepID=UPI0010C1F61B|nr:zinc ribbon domain-containing protein [Natronorubrum halophilum]